MIGLTGGSTTRVNVPAGQFTEDGDTLRWQPLVGTYRASGLETTADFTLPVVTVASADGTVSIDGVRMTGSSRKRNAKDPLGVGESAFVIERINAGEGIGARNVRVSSVTSEQGAQYYGAVVKYEIGEMQVPGLSFKNLQLHASARHLARDPLVRIAQTFEAIQDEARRGKNASSFTKAQEDALMKDVLALLQAQPVIAVDRLSVQQPSGAVTLDATATLPDAQGLNAATLKESPETLLAALNVRANLSGREQAVRELLTLADSGGRRGLAQNLGGLIEAGLLERKGDTVTATLNYGRGGMTLNGQDMGAF